ncbi:MAG: orotidine-5'-phosphate decarboxylase [Thiohalomonadales bacterium]
MDTRIIVALDFATTQQALDLASRLEPQQCKLKVGKELFTRGGPEIVRTLVEMGFDVFLDLKFHDIPNTVAKACLAAAELGVWMVNIHASGGRNMMLAARESIDQYSSSKGAPKPLLIAVTVLTSMTARDLSDIGITADTDAQVNRLAILAQQCDMDGVVCSPLEIASLRAQLGLSFRLVTPGVRPAGAKQDDQNRVMTPEAAIDEGADYLVIGRPIYQSSDPLQALVDINARIKRS